jgi:superfamily II DNA or RNA helicase
LADASGDGATVLTDGQAAAAEAFAVWLAAPWDGTPFVLSGYAGSGKTFLSIRLLALVERAGLCWTVVAPTHKAVGVVRRQLELSQWQKLEARGNASALAHLRYEDRFRV